MKILACIDSSRHAEDVLSHAAWASRQLNLPVEVLHALVKPSSATASDRSGSLGIDPGDVLLQQLADLDEQRNRIAQEHGRRLLDDAVALLRDQGVEQITQRIVHGSLVDHIGEYDASARLIVVGKQGENTAAGEDHLGINLERIIRTSKRPVLVVTGPWRKIERFVVAFDGGPTAGKAIDMLVNQPLLNDATAHLLMVGDRGASRQDQMVDASTRLRNSGYDVVGEMISGIPEEVIPEYAERIGAGLLIMGAYGHSRIRKWIVGSTTTALLRKSTVPLLVLR